MTSPPGSKNASPARMTRLTGVRVALPARSRSVSSSTENSSGRARLAQYVLTHRL
jgi:hypothetical protein